MSVTEAIIYVIIGVLGIFFLAVLLTFLNGYFCKKHNKKLQILLRLQPRKNNPREHFQIQYGFIALRYFLLQLSTSNEVQELKWQ